MRERYFAEGSPDNAEDLAVAQQEFKSAYEEEVAVLERATKLLREEAVLTGGGPSLELERIRADVDRAMARTRAAMSRVKRLEQKLDA